MSRHGCILRIISLPDCVKRFHSLEHLKLAYLSSPLIIVSWGFQLFSTSVYYLYGNQTTKVDVAHARFFITVLFSSIIRLCSTFSNLRLNSCFPVYIGSYTWFA